MLNYGKLSILIFIIGITQACFVNAQIDKTKIRLQIEEHQKWMEENTPKPDTLNDSTLIVMVLNAINSICIEPQVINIMQYAGAKYHLSDLIKYAEIRSKQEVDKNDSLARSCLEQLGVTSNKLFGAGSFSEAYAYFLLLHNSPSRIETKRCLPKFFAVAEQMMQKDSLQIPHQELWLLAQIWSILPIYSRTINNDYKYYNILLM